MDSGSVSNVIHPGELPEGCEVKPNLTGKHFVGANNSRIERFGECRTELKGSHGTVGCDWNCADVSRALHSVSQVCGPKEHATGKQDVLFNHRKCVVVPPGIVEEICRRINVVAEYPREGNLYIGEFEMSRFGRQGANA